MSCTEATAARTYLIPQRRSGHGAGGGSSQPWLRPTSRHSSSHRSCLLTISPFGLRDRDIVRSALHTGGNGGRVCGVLHRALTQLPIRGLDGQPGGAEDDRTDYGEHDHHGAELVAAKLKETPSVRSSLKPIEYGTTDTRHSSSALQYYRCEGTSTTNYEPVAKLFGTPLITPQIEAIYLESIRQFARQYSKIFRFTVRKISV